MTGNQQLVKYKDVLDLHIESRFPMLTETMATFKVAYGQHHPPLLLLELKGGAMNHDTLAMISQQCQMSGVCSSIFIWVTSEKDEALLNQFKSDKVHLKTASGEMSSSSLASHRAFCAGPGGV